MFDLPDTFKEDNEDYIVVNAMKNFINCRPNIKVKVGGNRRTLIQSISKYANESAEALEDTLQWVDSVAREGIKDLYIMELTDESLDIVRDVKKINELAAPELNKIKCKHLCNNKYSESLSLVRFQIENDETLIYTFYLCKYIYVYDGKHDEKVRLYPICINIYPDEGLIVGRGKPRQNMYKYEKQGFDHQSANKILCEHQILKGIQYILDLFKIKSKDMSQINWNFKNCLYKLLDKYTDTPPEILSLISENKQEIDESINIIADKVCVKGNKDDIASDIMNLVEKYFSISYEDKSIFIKGKEAYPLRIAATDEEESKIDQKSARENPLQSKAIFFDNKKMMQKNQMCDGVTFKFKRKSKKYYEDEFKVRINVKNNYCYIKFFEYTEEVDIQNVLRLLINS